MASINKDTKIYGSFSCEPGNFGCKFHNCGFQHLDINAIYKSFGVKDIKLAMEAVRTLGIVGVGISMPFKSEVLKHIDARSPECWQINASNTIINKDGHLVAHNTDCIAAQHALNNCDFDTLYILGDGGYAQAVKYACEKLEKEFVLITRDNWGDISELTDELIFNCTPVIKTEVNPPESCKYIDCIVSTSTGQILASIQAAEQFRLYTGRTYPCGILSFA